MPTDTVNIAIDVPMPRLIGDRMVKVCPAKEFDILNSSAGAYLEVIAYTGLLTPLPATAAWLTTTTGNYARLRKTDLSIASSTAWTEYERSYGGNWYQHSLNSNVTVETLQSYEQNRPMWLSWLNYNVGNEGYVALECGWGEGTNAEVTLRIFSDGSVEIYRNLDKVGSAKLNEKKFYPTQTGPQQVDDGAPSKIMANETVDMLLIPGRRRELLVLTNQGGGFNFLFEDIDPNEDDPMITGPGPFWFRVPNGQATVQLAPLKFEESGTLLSAAFQFREPPNTGEGHTELIAGDTAGYGTQAADVTLVEDDGATTFVPNGVRRNARLRVDMEGDGDSTPFVYGVSTAFGVVTVDSFDGTLLIDDWWMSAELDVPEDPEGVTFRVNLTNPAGIEAAGAVDLRQAGNRDIQAALGDISFFVGRTLDPEWEEGTYEDTTEMTLECRDRTLIMGQYRIQDPEPIDTLNFSDAIQLFAQMAGFPNADMDIGAIDYRLPSVEQNSEGQYAYLPEVGDTPVQWIRKLWEEFAQRCFWGWVPTASGILFRFQTPEQLGSESKRTVYLSNAAAVTDGRPAGDNMRWVYDWKPRVLQPEANDIYVVGRHPRTLRPIVGNYRDTASADPTLPIINRPDNWIGNLLQYSWVDPSLTSEADVAWALGNFADILPRRRYVAQMKAQFLLDDDGVPLWRGDVITVKGVPTLNGMTMDGKWRIKTLSVLKDLEYAHPSNAALDRIWRETTYVIERERFQ